MSAELGSAALCISAAFCFLSAASPDVALLNHYVGREETMACSVFYDSGSPISLPPPAVSSVISSGKTDNSDLNWGALHFT